MEKRFPSSGHSISEERADEILEALQPQRGPVDGSHITGMPFGNF